MSHAMPRKKRVVTFFDCQNLFKTVKNLWGYSFPNFDPIKLSQKIVSMHCGELWILTAIHIYTGIHDAAVNRGLHDFWNRKLLSHKASDSRVSIFTSPLRYSNGIPREKGIDIRIALDLVKTVRKGECDIVVLFSQDSDFTEVAKEVREIAKERGRWVKIASAFPYDASKNRIGIEATDWIHISKSDYDSCIDPTDYRIKP
jgi:uncharacterized LabA/DUF88 family protein